MSGFNCSWLQMLHHVGFFAKATLLISSATTASEMHVCSFLFLSSLSISLAGVMETQEGHQAMVCLCVSKSSARFKMYLFFNPFCSVQAKEMVLQ